MKYYRIEVSTNLDEVGIFPQRGEMEIGLHKDDPRHLFNQQNLSKLSSDVFIPSFKLRNNAKLTDVLSFPINHDWVVSGKLKTVFEGESIPDIQFMPIRIIQKDNLENYFLFRSLKSSIEQIDFLKTEISIMKTTWEEEEKIKVRDVQDFSHLLEKIKYPKSIKIDQPFFMNECNLKFLSINYVYGVFPFFISEQFKNVLLQNSITGIRYMELDEVL